MAYGNDNEKQRGWILRILDRCYPDPLDRDTIKKQLVDLKFLTSDIDIRGNIAYLQEKSLIKSDIAGIGEFQRTLIYLTAYGKDVVDKLKKAPIGVDL
jgi:hypothetical protein